MIIDVSSFQGAIKWAKTAPTVDFAILRASVGVNTDNQYKTNVAGCEANGIPYHAYHYVKATGVAGAKAEAAVFARVTDGTAPLFYVIDAEYKEISASSARTVFEAFEAELRRIKGGNIRVALYIAHELYDTWVLDYSRYDYVWIPRYGKNTGKPDKRPDHPCDLWQYTDRGTIDGVNGHCDLNALNSDKPMSFYTGGKQMFTNMDLVRFCEKVYADKWVYWYGTCGYKCTTPLYNGKKNQYPSHYTAKRTAAYEADIKAGKMCADCVGMIKAFFWKGGSMDGANKYASNNCPDTSANGMIKLCKESGPIDTMPDIPGLVVWKNGHIGVYIGNGYTIEMKGFDYDCKRNKLSDGPWTKWGRLPANMIVYVADDPAYEGLRRGDEGNDVRDMQRLLLRWNSNALPKWGADGDFGSETEAAVMAFQREKGLQTTGIYNAETEAALKLYNLPNVVTDKVKVTGGAVNVRTGPNTNSKVLGVVHKGDLLTYQGEDSADGWHLVTFDNRNAWISGKYSEIVRWIV